MDIGQLNTVGIGRIYGAYDCPCCGSHEQTARVAFGAGAVAKLPELMTDVAPSGATVTIAYDRNAESVFVAVRRACMRSGLLCCECALDADASIYEAERVEIPEQTRAIVAVGGGSVIDLVKYAAQFHDLPVFVVYTGCDASPLAPSSLLLCKGAPTRYAVDVPKGLVCDPTLLPDDPERDAAAMGSVLAVLTALFDRYIASAVCGESYCPSLAEQAYAAVAELVEHLEGALRPSNAKTALAQANLRLSQLTVLKGDSWLVAGSEIDAYGVLKLLYKHEGFRCRSQGETALLLSRILLRVYRSTLESLPLKGFYPPPDNNARSDLLERFLRIPAADAALRVSPIDRDQSRTMYKLCAVRDEALSLVKRYAALQDRGFSIFRRLYPDYGYALLGYIEPADAKLAIGLAPDMGGKTTFLTLMKNAGLLEGYLV